MLLLAFKVSQASISSGRRPRRRARSRKEHVEPALRDLLQARRASVSQIPRSGQQVTRRPAACVGAGARGNSHKLIIQSTRIRIDPTAAFGPNP